MPNALWQFVSGATNVSFSGAVLATSPDLFWLFDDSPATATTPNLGSIGVSQNLTYSGAGPGLGETGLLTDAPDASKTAFRADDPTTGGVGDTGSATGLPTAMTAWSVMAVIKPGSLSGFQALFSLAGTGGTNSFVLFLVNQDIEMWVNGSDISFFLSSMTIGNIYHIVFTYDGTLITWYLNGAQVQQSSDHGVTANMSYTPPYFAFTGTDAAGSAFDGTTQATALWERALSGVEVAALYAAGT